MSCDPSLPVRPQSVQAKVQVVQELVGLRRCDGAVSSNYNPTATTVNGGVRAFVIHFFFAVDVVRVSMFVLVPVSVIMSLHSGKYLLPHIFDRVSPCGASSKLKNVGHCHVLGICVVVVVVVAAVLMLMLHGSH